MYFKNILIANRGEIAVRIISACHELGIRATAVYSDADRGAYHVRRADQAVLIGPAAAADSYLRVDRIVDAAVQAGCDAVHPGYGFLSEQAALARACAAAGLAFIGPLPDTIELMGSKIAAKRLAQQAGVPTVPGYLGDDQRAEVLNRAARDMGFPLLIKASAGGGGRGMRVVPSAGEFDAALEAAQREAQAAFGDATVMLERLVERPRHVEIQVLADTHGTCVHLFERECSIQRRHQKIIEEAPSPALDPALRAEMGAAAVRLAQAAAYVNAGTVEFVLDKQGRFFFLEMNTRLQVEHPVTELTTGLDLVQLQIAIAAGTSLPFAQSDLAQRGHAIEVRVYAENPATMLPSIGRVAVFEPPRGPGIRNDAGLAGGDAVGMFYDPLIAKLIVYAADRPAAIARLQAALRNYAVLGVDTNIALLQAIAAHPWFASGATTTDFLEQAGVLAAGPAPSPPDPVLAAIALVEASRPPHRPADPDPWTAGAWRALGERVVRYTSGENQYTVTIAPAGNLWRVVVDMHAFLVQLVAQHASECVIAIVSTDGSRTQQERIWLALDGADWLASWQGASYRVAPAGPLSVDRYRAGTNAAAGHASLEAPMPGMVVKVLVSPGQHVEAHQPLVVLEAMKMEHVVSAPYAGIVERIACAAGTLVGKGAVLVEVDAA